MSALPRSLPGHGDEVPSCNTPERVHREEVWPEIGEAVAASSRIDRMLLRPASEDEINDLAHLVVGDRSQASTVALMRLFEVERLADIIEMTQVMIASTGGWQSMVVADRGRGPVGLVQVGEAFAAMTPEVIEFAHRFYGESFLELLGPRLAAMVRVQATYPPDCLLIAEIHVAPQHRGEGIGNSLLASVVERALAEGVRLLGLQTLTNNPARSVFETWGFKVADTRTDLDFEEYSGAAGYHLMLRHM